VTDSGIGISPEGLEQLFTPFSQLDSGLARQFEGTGLGLAMVKLLAELHGGSVAVESAVGQGSCFTVWLPFRALDGVAPGPLTLPAAPRVEVLAGTRTALVVEDDFKAADLIRLQLEAEGFTVLHAASAKTAPVTSEQVRWIIWRPSAPFPHPPPQQLPPCQQICEYFSSTTIPRFERSPV
jgi:hypothetical protein